MNGPAARRALFALALALGVVCAWGTWRAWQGADAERAADGAYPAGEGATARRLLARLAAGLSALQEADGGFSPWAPEDRTALPEPEVKRTASTALAAWALVEAVRLDVRVPGHDLVRAKDRALAHLAARQGAPPGDGALGRMPKNPLGADPDRGAEVTALAAAVIAWSRDDPRRDAVALTRAARELGKEARGGVRNGWLRGLVAMAIDALLRAGRTGDLGLQPHLLLAAGEAPAEADCGDFRVAEAIVRVLRREAEADRAYPARVLATCVADEPPAWNGLATDTGSWLLQAWLAGRTADRRPWFGLLLPAAEEALAPSGWVPGGLYADRVAQTACAALALAQGLDPQVLAGP